MDEIKVLLEVLDNASIIIDRLVDLIKEQEKRISSLEEDVRKLIENNR